MRNERRLARRAARGDRDAFAAIFRHYQQDLYRYCVAILGDPHDAQDALQNTMVKALVALPGERREIELKPWLYRIAHNESIELRRRARPVEPLEEGTLAAVADPDRSAAARQRLRDLLADIGELPVRQRGALVMRELGGLDFEEIGAALETSPAAARQVLYEARRGLAQMSEGRDMPCGEVTMVLSEGDGRATRRRDIQAHLRDCAQCRTFSEQIRSRTETLAGIAPLPAIAAAAMLKGALSGAAAGGGSVGAAGAVAGAGAKAVSTATILKSAAGVVAIVAAGAVAVDHGQLVPGGSGSSPSGESAGAVTRSVDAASSASSPSGAAAADDAVVAGSQVGAEDGGRGRSAEGTRHVDRDTALVKTSHAGSKASGKATSEATTNSNAAGNRGHAPGSATAHPTHPTPPVHPTHPSHPTHPAHPEHSTAHKSTGKSATTKTHSKAPHKATHPVHPKHPSHPVTSAAATTEATKTPPAATANQAPTPSPSGKEAEASPPPGQAHKQATEEATAE